MASDHTGAGYVREQDPSALTTDQIRREIEALSERVDLKVEAVVKRLEVRLDAIDRATALFEKNLTQVPTDVDRAIGHLEQYHGEKFAGVSEAFSELRSAIEKSERVTKVAVDAALEAAGKANAAQAETFLVSSNKTETNFTKQIDQLALLIQASTRALDDKIVDAKDRLTRLEGQNLGRSAAQGSRHTGDTLLVSSMAVGVAFLSLIISIIMHFWK